MVQQYKDSKYGVNIRIPGLKQIEPKETALQDMKECGVAQSDCVD